MAAPLVEMHEATAVQDRLDDLDAFESGQMDNNLDLTDHGI